MNTAQEFTLIDTLREWSRMVAGGSKVKHVVTPNTQAECLAIMEKALTLPAWFGAKGITCRVSGSADVVKKGFRITVERCEFVVNPVQVPYTGKRPQAVTATSREAYHSLPINDLCKEVVRAALKAGETYDRGLAMLMGKNPSDISARRNDLQEMGEFEYEGKRYRIEYTQIKPSAFSGRRVQWWQVVEVNAQQTLFQC